jgi:hypothetical protein
LPFKPNQTAVIFIAVLWPAAFLTGLAVHAFPQMVQSGFPAYSWPLIIAFLVEAALRPKIDRKTMPPLTMPWRFIGVIVATLITMGTSGFLDGRLDLENLFSGL